MCIQFFTPPSTLNGNVKHSSPKRTLGAKQGVTVGTSHLFGVAQLPLTTLGFRISPALYGKIIQYKLAEVMAMITSSQG